MTIAGEVHNQERETFVYQYRIGGDPSSQIDLQKYIMPGIGDSTETNARAMNGQGQIASEAYVSKRGKRTIWHAVVYCPTTEIVTDLGTLGGEDSIARAINDIGDVVGMSDIQSNQVSSTFLLTEGVMWDLAELIDRDENGELPYGMFGGHYLVYDHPTINNLRFICGPGGDYDDENRAYLSCTIRTPVTLSVTWRERVVTQQQLGPEPPPGTATRLSWGVSVLRRQIAVGIRHNRLPRSA